MNFKFTPTTCQKSDRTSFFFLTFTNASDICWHSAECHVARKLELQEYTSSVLWQGKEESLAMEVRSAPTQTRQSKESIIFLCSRMRFTVYEHSAFMVECPNKKLFEDFAQSIRWAVSIGLPHNDSPVIAWERGLTGDWVAHHIGMTKPSISSQELDL